MNLIPNQLRDTIRVHPEGNVGACWEAFIRDLVEKDEQRREWMRYNNELLEDGFGEPTWRDWWEMLKEFISGMLP